jgi:hypothetical protein
MAWAHWVPPAIGNDCKCNNRILGALNSGVFLKGRCMRKLLLACAGGALMSLPAICGASTVTFEGTNTLLFDPRGCSPSNLPSTCFYRAYDCRIGGKFTLPEVVYTTPGSDDKGPKGGDNTPPQQNFPTNKPPCNPPQDNVPVIPPQGGDSCPPHHGQCAAVPVPDSAAMGGIGVAAMTLLTWLRARRQARA